MNPPHRAARSADACLATHALAQVAPDVGRFLDIADRVRFTMAHPRFAHAHAHASLTEQKWNVRDVDKFLADLAERKMPALVRRKPGLRALTVHFHAPVAFEAVARTARVIGDAGVLARFFVKDAASAGALARLARERPDQARAWCMVAQARTSAIADHVVDVIERGGAVDEVTVCTHRDAARVLAAVGAATRPAALARLVITPFRGAPAGRPPLAPIDDHPPLPDSPPAGVDVVVVWAAGGRPAPATSRLAAEIIDASPNLMNFPPRGSVDRAHRLRVLHLNAAELLRSAKFDSVAALASFALSMRVHPAQGAQLVFEQRSVETPDIVPFLRELVRRIDDAEGPDPPRLRCGCRARGVFVHEFGTDAQRACARLAARRLAGAVTFLPRRVGIARTACARCVARAEPDLETYDGLLHALRRDAPHLHLLWADVGTR